MAQQCKLIFRASFKFVENRLVYKKNEERKVVVALQVGDAVSTSHLNSTGPGRRASKWSREQVVIHIRIDTRENTERPSSAFIRLSKHYHSHPHSFYW